MWKDGKLKTVHEQLGDLRVEGHVERVERQEIHNHKSKTDHQYEYSHKSLTHKEHEFYYINHGLQISQVGEVKPIDNKQFIFLSSIMPNKANIKELTEAGRMRWKIENEGFNTQKNQGLKLHHKYVRKNFKGIRNFYICMQIAHIIDQLFILCKNKIMQGWKTIKGLWKKLLGSLLTVQIILSSIKQNKKLNFRY